MAGGETRMGRPALRSSDEARQLVLDVLGAHAESLLRVARGHSLCLDDAHDAYQRAVEIFLHHAATLDRADAHKWLHTVVKHEAMAVRRARLRTVGGEDVDFDGHEAGDLTAPDEQAARFERLTRSAEALQRLKPQELQALWLRAQGHSYQEIADLCDWTYTKVNRCISEGRRSFLARYEGIVAGEECRRWEGVLSAMVDGEASAAELAQARPHLRHCAACRATMRALRESNAGLAAVLPVPAAAVGVHGGSLSRALDTLLGPLQERVAATALKLQSGIEAVTAAKVAAVAAGAAAIAGGGVAIDQAVDHAAPQRRQRATVSRPVRVSAPSRRAAVVLPRTTPPAPPRATRTHEFAVRRTRAQTAAARSPAAREFAPAATATAASARSVSPPAAHSGPARTAAREFGTG